MIMREVQMSIKYPEDFELVDKYLNGDKKQATSYIVK